MDGVVVLYVSDSVLEELGFIVKGDLFVLRVFC